MSRKGSGAFGVVIVVLGVALAAALAVKFDILGSDEEPEERYIATNRELLIDYANSSFERNLVYTKDDLVGLCYALHGGGPDIGRIQNGHLLAMRVPCTDKVEEMIRLQRVNRKKRPYRLNVQKKPKKAELPPPSQPTITLDGFDGEQVEFEDVPPLEFELIPGRPQRPGNLAPVITEPPPKDAAPRRHGIK